MAVKKNEKDKKAHVKLRIAMFGHKRVPSREGGIEIVVEELATRMISLGYDVTCYNRSGHHVSGSEFDTPKVTQWKGIHMKYVPTIQKKGLSAVSASFFAALASAMGRYDVVHIHAEGPAYFAWIPKLSGKKVVVTVHGLDHRRAKWGKLASTYIMMGEKNAVKYADEIIVLSRSAQKYFKEVYGRDTKYIPNGVARPEIRDDRLIREKFGLKRHSYFLFLGRIVPEKGLTYLVQAFKGVDTDKKLVIAGGSSDTDKYTAEIKEIASDDERIIFTGFVQGELYKSVFSNAYVYVLPSDLEGMPLSLLEALSYDNCCLTSNISECKDVIEENGLTFRKADVKDLKEKMQMLCNMPMLVSEYRSVVRDFVCRKYNWDTVVRQTLELYGSL